MFKLSSEKTIIIAPKARTVLEKYKNKLPAKESGGILLGKVFKNQCIVIDEVSEPSKADKAGWYFFERSKKEAQKIIDSNWTKSGGRLIYLGEWHTHNDFDPTPSQEDMNMISDLLNTSKMEIDFLITIIVGIKSNYIGIQTKEGLKKLTISNNPFTFNF